MNDFSVQKLQYLSYVITTLQIAKYLLINLINLVVKNSISVTLFLLLLVVHLCIRAVTKNYYQFLIVAVVVVMHYY